MTTTVHKPLIQEVVIAGLKAEVNRLTLENRAYDVRADNDTSLLKECLYACTPAPSIGDTPLTRKLKARLGV